MRATLSGPQSSADLLIGDYLRVTAERVAADGHGADEGFARIERIEHVPADQADGVFEYQLVTHGPVPVVWCHGLPGPIVLRGGDVRVLDVSSPRRVQHDTAHPWWPPAAGVLLCGAHAAGTAPHWRRRKHDRTASDLDWPEPAARDRVQRRPTSFTKPASALLLGDYLGLHPGRWPETDREIDEGFSRIGHLRLLDADAAAEVFADPSWHTGAVIASLHGLPGVLLLRDTDEVPVLAFVNPEREAWERRHYGDNEATHLLRGSHPPDDAEHHTASQIDAARRPRVDEAELYPSEFTDHFTRRMSLESEHGFRSVPLAALPWPHHQSNCPLGALADEHQNAVPDEHAAHAAAALPPAGQRIRSSCAYHQPDWPRLVRMLEESLATAGDDLPDGSAHPEYDQLSPDDQEWLRALVADPIRYDDGSDSLTNGQHRLCAMRFAGVQRCPVLGDYLPDTNYDPPCPAARDARTEIAASWNRLAVEMGWPAPIAGLARFLPPAWRARLINNRSR